MEKASRSAPRWRWPAALVAVAMVTAVTTHQIDRARSSGSEAEADPDRIDLAGVAEAHALQPVEVPVAGVVVTVEPVLPLATAGSSAAVVVEARSEAPLSSLELWVDDELVERVEVEGDDELTAVRVLRWSPVAASDVPAVVLARATRRDGRTGQSNVARVAVVDANAPTTAVGGESLTFAPLDRPLVDQLAGLPPELSERVSELEAQPDLELIASSRLPTAPPTAWSAEAPTTSVTVDGCTATTAIKVPDGAEQVAVFLLTPTSSAYMPIASISEDDAAVPVPVAAGANQILTVAYAGGAGVWGAPTPAVADDCVGTWTGDDVRLVDGVLTAGTAADSAYAYLSVDGARWQRVPAAPQSSVPRLGGGYNLGPYLPALAGHQLDIEAWGWQGDTLVRLGRAHLEAPPELGVEHIVGAADQVHLDLVRSVGTSEVLVTEEWMPTPTAQTFRWSTSLPGVTHALWQVSMLPAAPGAGLDAPAVVAQGVTTPAAGQFSVDFADLATKPDFKIPPNVLQPLTYDQASGTGGAAPTPLVVDPKLLAGLTPLAHDGWYVRVVPMVGDQFPGSTSNLVQVHEGQATKLADDTSTLVATPVLQPGALPVAPDAYQLNVEFTPPRPPSPDRMACFQFQGWDPAALDFAQYAPQYKFWAMFLSWLDVYGEAGQQSPICAGCYSSPGSSTSFTLGGGKCAQGGLYIPVLSDLVAAGITLWDTLVQTFSIFKGMAVDALVTLSGCSTDVCKQVAALVVDAVLIYAGIPPTLPSFGEVVEGLKGDLAAMASALASSIGIPCDDLGTAAQVVGQEELTCEALAKQMIDELADQVTAQFQQAASQVLGVVVPPGMLVSPHPDGQTPPTAVTIKVTPTPSAPADGRTCDATVSMYSTWKTPSILSGKLDTELTALALPGNVVMPLKTGIFAGPVELPAGTYGGKVFESVVRTLPPSGSVAVTLGLPAAHPPLSVSGVTKSTAVTVNGKPTLNRRGFQAPRQWLQLQPTAKTSVAVTSSCTPFTWLTKTVPG